jgi:hypothetical protein
MRRDNGMEGFVRLRDVLGCLYDTIESYHIKRNIMELPTYDVKPVVRGKWGKDGDCSVCGCQPWYERDIHTLNYCPNCGATMKEENHG